MAESSRPCNGRFDVLNESMSKPERLLARGKLSNTSDREEQLSSPEWHLHVLADRKARAQRGEGRFLTLAQLI